MFIEAGWISLGYINDADLPLTSCSPATPSDLLSGRASAVLPSLIYRKCACDAREVPAAGASRADRQAAAADGGGDSEGPARRPRRAGPTQTRLSDHLELDGTGRDVPNDTDVAEFVEVVLTGRRPRMAVYGSRSDEGRGRGRTMCWGDVSAERRSEVEWR